jgi:hypothetical protein
VVDAGDRDLTQARARRRSHNVSDGGMHSLWKRFDNQWMKPIFGGSSGEPLSFLTDDEAEEEEEEVQELMGRHARGSGARGAVLGRDKRTTSDSSNGGEAELTLPRATAGGKFIGQERRGGNLTGAGPPLRSSKYQPPEGDGL